jgi:hypothetical protein
MAAKYIIPSGHYMETYEVDAMVVTDRRTGKTHTINGNRVTVWIGKRGSTVAGYDTRTGRYTEKVKHVKNLTFVGHILGTQFTPLDVTF